MTINGKQYAIKDLMRPAVLISKNATLKEALEKMVKEKRNSLTVVDDNGETVGAVNALDIIKAVLPEYIEEDEIAARFADEALFKEDAERVKDIPVSDFMAKDIAIIQEGSGLIEAATMALKHGRGRIIVTDANNKPIGILTRTEIKKVIAAYLGIKPFE